MAVMPAEVQEVFKNARVATLCTAREDGQANGNIIMMKTIIDDETIYLSDQYFNKTMKNLEKNNKVAVVFCHENDAYEIYGTARYVNEGPEFEEQAAWVNALFEQMGMPAKAKGGIFVTVDEVYFQGGGPEAGAKIAG